VGAVPLLLGIVVAVLLGAVFVKHLTGPFTRFTTGTPVEGFVEAGDGRTIYVAVDQPPSYDLACRVTDATTEAVVDARSSTAVTYTRGDEEFRSFETFEAPRDARYRVTCSAGEPMRMAVGPDIDVVKEVGRLFGAFGAAGLGLVLSAIVIALTAVFRHRHRRRLQGLA
jgi:hypothetical protein